MSLALAWARAFALTYVIELGIVFALTRTSKLAPARKSALVFFAHLATHPATWFVFPIAIAHEWGRLAVSEAWSIGLEAAFYALVFPMKPTRSLAVAAAANAVSFGVVFALRAFHVA